jgi:hypothetical protein
MAVADLNTDALVSILLDRSARTDERDDAAGYLGSSDDPAVLAALLRVASDPAEDEVVSATSGESLAEIFVRRDAVDPAWLRSLVPAALAEVLPWLARARPELLPRDA